MIFEKKMMLLKWIGRGLFIFYCILMGLIINAWWIRHSITTQMMIVMEVGLTALVLALYDILRQYALKVIKQYEE